MEDFGNGRKYLSDDKYHLFHHKKDIKGLLKGVLGGNYDLIGGN